VTLAAFARALGLPEDAGEDAIMAEIEARRGWPTLDEHIEVLAETRFVRKEIERLKAEAREREEQRLVALLAGASPTVH